MLSQSIPPSIWMPAVKIYSTSTAFMTDLKPLSGQKSRSMPASADSTQQPSARWRNDSMLSPVPCQQQQRRGQKDHKKIKHQHRSAEACPLKVQSAKLGTGLLPGSPGNDTG